MSTECRSKDCVEVDILIQKHLARRPHQDNDIVHAHGITIRRLVLSRLQPIKRIAFVITSRLLPARTQTVLSTCILHPNTFGGSERGLYHLVMEYRGPRNPQLLFALQHSYPAAYQSTPLDSGISSHPATGTGDRSGSSMTSLRTRRRPRGCATSSGRGLVLYLALTVGVLRMLRVETIRKTT